MNLKSTFMLVLLSLFTMNCNAQNVPQSVKDAFKAKFPEAKEVEWGKESDTEYEAEFELGDVDYSANFDINGKWLETEKEIAKNDLPDGVLASLARDFWYADIHEVAEITSVDGVLYEVEIGMGDEDGDEEHGSANHEEDDEDEEREHSERIELIFDATGKLVKSYGLEERD